MSRIRKFIHKVIDYRRMGWSLMLAIDVAWEMSR